MKPAVYYYLPIISHVPVRIAILRKIISKLDSIFSVDSTVQGIFSFTSSNKPARTSLLSLQSILYKSIFYPYFVSK